CAGPGEIAEQRGQEQEQGEGREEEEIGELRAAPQDVVLPDLAPQAQSQLPPGEPGAGPQHAHRPCPSPARVSTPPRASIRRCKSPAGGRFLRLSRIFGHRGARWIATRQANGSLRCGRRSAITTIYITSRTIPRSRTRSTTSSIASSCGS